MKRLVTMLVGAFALGCASEEDLAFHRLQPIDMGSVVCGCTFHESLSDADEASYSSGPEVLTLDIHGDPPSARINLGADDLRLGSEDLSHYDCVAGSIWPSRWRSAGVALRVELVVSGPGAEACWFTGTATAASGSTESSVALKGACGC